MAQADTSHAAAIRQAAQLLRTTEYVMALTGAGISEAQIASADLLTVGSSG